MTADAAPDVWVVGGGGLLGRSVLQHALRDGHRIHRSVVPWGDPTAALTALIADAELLLGTRDDVDLLWCAGAGVVASSETSLREEVALLETFVDRLVDVLASAREVHGPRTLRVFLASSAGGVYAGSSHPPFTEDTDPVPLAAYGHAKLDGEAVMTRLADAGVSVLIGRIANLYGPGQNAQKPQGIITQLCRSHLRRTPLSIYVSLDTSRDYVFVHDAARMALAGLRRLAAEPPGTVVTKIFASHVPTTLASVLGEMRRITKRRPAVVLGTSPNARFQTRDLRFRSVVWQELDEMCSTPLPEGIAATLADVARTEFAHPVVR